jgi:hypothetical protein
MAKTVSALILESGAARGDLVYIRIAGGSAYPGAQMSTAPDLLALKAEAIGLDEPLIASGPAVDETYADIVIDANPPEPTIVKMRAAGGPTERASAFPAG